MTNWEKYNKDIEYENGWVKNWFSNMLVSVIEIDGETYQSTENYYQSQKMTNEKDRHYIKNLNPHESKTKARKLTIREDWDSHKLVSMRIALETKFNLPEWKEKLLATRNDKIIEWNNWGDKFWGVSVKDNLGQNHLGLMLMEIRTNLRMNSLFKNKLKTN